jgi:hypothetical protein
MKPVIHVNISIILVQSSLFADIYKVCLQVHNYLYWMNIQQNKMVHEVFIEGGQLYQISVTSTEQLWRHKIWTRTTSHICFHLTSFVHKMHTNLTAFTQWEKYMNEGVCDRFYSICQMDARN